MTRPSDSGASGVDWSGELEAVHEDGRVVEASTSGARSLTGRYWVRWPLNATWADPDGRLDEEWHGWRIRNRQPQPADTERTYPQLIEALLADADSGRHPQLTPKEARAAGLALKLVAEEGWRDQPADTVTVGRMTEAEAREPWGHDGIGAARHVAILRKLGLIKPEPSPLDRFMAAHPDADRATAEKALAWGEK